MSKPRILVAGSSNTDMIIRVANIPRPGETILGGEFMTAAGGKGANQAVGAARAGGAVTFVARVGTDMFGERAVAGFSAEGIDVTHVIRDATRPSGVALIFVGQSGENSIAVASGANANLSPKDVQDASSLFAGTQVLVMQLETPVETVQAAAAIASEAGAVVILNPAPARPLPPALLAHVTILTPNESEAELLTGIKVDSAAAAGLAAEKLLGMGVKSVIITMGARGSFVADAAGKRVIEGFKVEALDTTAAGDCFNGALAVALAEGKPMDAAVRFANAAGALSVTKMGAQPSLPSRSEIDQFLAGR